VIHVSVKHTSLTWRIEKASRVFAVSALISATGIVVELVVFAVSSSVILLTDLFHWFVDTVLEVVFLFTLLVASRSSRRFPWSTVIVESSLTSISCLVVLGVYFYLFTGYLFSFSETMGISTQNYTPLIATITGGALTVLTYNILSRSYRRYRVELLRVDSLHALLDVVASIVASLGVALAAYTGSLAVEMLFTFILMLFVFHSMIEVFKNNIKAITGGQLNVELSAEIRRRLKEEISRSVEIINAEARRLGSFYVVSVELAVEPDTTVLELHRLRKRVIKTIAGISELIYHIDVKFNPKYKWREKRVRRALNAKRDHR
jgi:cation diffusion facilitator family transporter